MENGALGRKLLITAVVVLGVFKYVAHNPDSVKLELDEKKEQDLSARLLDLQKKHNAFSKEIDPEKRKVIMSGEEIREMNELYIFTHYKLAQKVYQEYDIPASVVMAQALNEGGAGSSDLAQEAHNNFGVKHWAHSHKEFEGQEIILDEKGKPCCIEHEDNEVYDHFKIYKDDEESFLKGYVGVFYKDLDNKIKKERYEKCFDCGDVPKCWAYAIKKAGYATDLEYSLKLIKYMDDYDLYKLDKGMDYILEAKK
ncbi:MAG: glucosaminidase domain-containing protein [bacterium]|nr:glucosaminidase domain-containing protein [bacterium]